jgi:oxygen-dependent protoporphyrinogen oxidase
MIAVVGGGITGLSLGHRLTEAGADCVVLEAGEQAGGVIRSRIVDGHLLDWGPQRARLVGDLRSLIDELDLEDQTVTSPPGLPLYVYRGGRLREVPFSAGAFLTSDIVGWGAKVRVALEPLTPGPDDDESVADFFSRKIGAELYHTLVGPLYGGLYGSDPADMVVGLSLGHVLREFGVGRSLILSLLRKGGRVSPPPACSFREGMQTLPRALADRLGDRLRLECPVDAVAPRPGRGWRVETSQGPLEAEAVVLTTPAPVTSRLLEGVDRDAADRVGSLNYNPLGVVHLRAETDLEGLGFQVSFDEPLALRGVTFNDSLFGRTGVYTAYVGGAKRPEVVSRSDADLAALAVDEFRQCTGFDAVPVAVERERMPAWDRSWAALQGLQLPDGLHIAANWESRPGIPGRLAQTRRLAARLTAGTP